MVSMILDQYYQAFYGLLNEVKGVSHCESDIQRGCVSSGEFCRRTGLLLAKLNDDDLLAVANKIKPTKYFNIVIQAHWTAVNLEANKRGWPCLI